MGNQIKDFIYESLNIEETVRYEFRTICGFTFAFKKEEIRINNHLSSAEILPAGIIYEENGEFYFAPLHDAVEIDEVMKSFVEEVI